MVDVVDNDGCTRGGDPPRESLADRNARPLLDLPFKAFDGAGDELRSARVE